MSPPTSGKLTPTTPGRASLLALTQTPGRGSHPVETQQTQVCLDSLSTSIDSGVFVPLDALQHGLNEMQSRLTDRMQGWLERSISREFDHLRIKLQSTSTQNPASLQQEPSILQSISGEGVRPASRAEGQDEFPRNHAVAFDWDDQTKKTEIFTPGSVDVAGGIPSGAISSKESRMLDGIQSAEVRDGIEKITYALSVQPKADGGDAQMGRNSMRAGEGQFLQVVVLSRPFQIAVFVVIIAQAALLGAEANINMANALDRINGHRSSVDQPGYIRYLGYTFNVFFFLELVVRIGAWRLRFFNPQDQEFFAWNIFDLCVFGGLILELVDVKTDLLRAFRLLRVARVLRILRMFEKLRKMIYALLHSLTSLFWLMFILAATLYVFALAFMLGAYRELLQWDPKEYQALKASGYADDEGAETLVKKYSSVLRIMKSMFSCLTGGEEWVPLFEPITRHSWWYSCVSIFFILFFVFAVLNIVTGVFVDEAMKISELDKDIQISDAIQKAQQDEADVRHFVSSVDENQDGTVTHEELAHMLTKKQVRRWLAGCDIDLNPKNVGVIIQNLDEDNTGVIDPVKFFDILIKLKGEARSSDLFLLSNEIKLEQKRLARMLKVELSVSKKVDVLERDVLTLRQLV